MYTHLAQSTDTKKRSKAALVNEKKENTKRERAWEAKAWVEKYRRVYRCNLVPKFYMCDYPVK
jgi:hypothetical protein